MEYPGDLAADIALDCTLGYKKPFDGFGKSRPLQVCNTRSQERRRGEKPGIYIKPGRCGMKLRHLWTLMEEMADHLKTNAVMLPSRIEKMRKEEIGDEYRNSDDFNRRMLK